ncbi:MAG: uracil-DNA glycosylase [Alphaproteobacteria bacterium]|nr:uracil-DNA glycosylase [Alphaproteobacteria bacterium]
MQHTLRFPESVQKAAKIPFADYSFPSSVKGWNGLALVGEAPGAEEARLGRPFVGRSGQLLDKMLENAGIERAACLIANVFRFQPPGNKVDHFFASRRAAAAEGFALAESFGKFGSAYCRAEFAVELEHLRDVLAREKPLGIVALGRTPLWALTGENGLLDKVGRTLPCRFLPSAPVIPTYHPSFILRGNWKLQEGWLGHFRAARERARF